MNQQHPQIMPRVVVTGSNSGIGLSTVELFLRKVEPYEIIMTARTPQKGQQAISELRSKYPNKPIPKLLILDLLSESSIEQFVQNLRNIGTLHKTN